MLKAKSSENFLSPKICKFLFPLGAWRSGGMKCSDFYCKRHVLAWIHVVWGILREDWLGGLTSRGGPEKSQKVTRGSHRNDVSPLTQGLRSRTACDYVIDVYLNMPSTPLPPLFVRCSPRFCGLGVFPPTGETVSWLPCTRVKVPSGSVGITDLSH